MGMVRDETKTLEETIPPRDENTKTSSSVWMTGNIKNMLAMLGDVVHMGCIIDAGSYSAIRKVSGKPLELKYTSAFHGWSDHAIKSVPGLGSCNSTLFDYNQARGPLRKMGITVEDIKKAVSSNGHIVNLRAGERERTRGARRLPKLLSMVAYPQKDEFENDDSCVVKAAASAISYYNPYVAQELITQSLTLFGWGSGRSSINGLRKMLHNLGVMQHRIPGNGDAVSIEYLAEVCDGLYVATIKDQNGTGGHCVGIDAFRKVIVDPSEEREIRLDRTSLLKSAGPCAMCIEFIHVIRIDHIPDVKFPTIRGARGQLNKNQKRRDRRNKKRKGSKKNDDKRDQSKKTCERGIEGNTVHEGGGENFAITDYNEKTYVFQRGMIRLPCELSQDYFAVTYKNTWSSGTQCSAKSAPMRILGATIGATRPRETYQFKDDEGNQRMLPRRNKNSRRGEKGCNTLEMKWVIDLAHSAELLTLAYLSEQDPAMRKKVLDAKNKIPIELRVGNSCFTSMALVGDVGSNDGNNHPHRDRNDLTSLIITLGDKNVTGGRTLYYRGGSCFKLKDPYRTCGEVMASTKFVHGQYQIGPFESVLHGGEQWSGHRVVISFYLCKKILHHFYTYGRVPFDEQLSTEYK
jgi:hypothetical protein